jgi:gamma-glutamyltranspeptidase / glutathione hydrolase
MNRKILIIALIIPVLLLSSCTTAPKTETALVEIITGQVATGTQGMVASAHELASMAGAEILAAGGNAIDAAVATAFAITVVEPNASSLGGEGYMVLSLADGRDIAIDFRSWSPGFVTKDSNTKPRSGPESTCIPGLVAGLALALEQYGTMSLLEVTAPAVRIAREGFPLGDVLLSRLSDVYKDLGTDPVAGPIYFPDGLIPEPGTIMVNEDLAHALELIGEQGPSAFYRGEIADAIVEAMDGWITSADLQRYQAIERDVVTSNYRGFEVIGAPPIVAGIVVAEALNILENFDLSSYNGWDDPEAVHLISQALLLASADRAPYIGDPDYYNIPIEGLLSEQYAKERAKLIDTESAFAPTRSTPAGDPTPYTALSIAGAIDGEGSGSTTQVSVLDNEGNAVSITQTISSFWGSKDMIPGFGFFMNNEFHNFNYYHPDYPNDVNVVGPYKRPRTVIAPTIVRDAADEVFLVLGTPGAGRIPSSVVETIVNIIDFGMNMEDAIKTPKFCSRVGYKELRVEGGYSESTLEALLAKGHTLKSSYGELDYYFGGLNAIMVNDNEITGVGSFRRSGGAAGF